MEVCIKFLIRIKLIWIELWLISLVRHLKTMYHSHFSAQRIQDSRLHDIYFFKDIQQVLSVQLKLKRVISSLSVVHVMTHLTKVLKSNYSLVLQVQTTNLRASTWTEQTIPILHLMNYIWLVSVWIVVNSQNFI